MIEVKELIEQTLISAGTYREVAKVTGLSITTISKIINNRPIKKVSLDNYNKLVKFYNRDDLLLNDTDLVVDYRGSGIENPNKPKRVRKEKRGVVEKYKNFSSRQKAIEFLKKMFDVYREKKTVIPNWYIYREDKMVEDMRNEGYDIQYYYINQKEKEGNTWSNGYVELIGRKKRRIDNARK